MKREGAALGKDGRVPPTLLPVVLAFSTPPHSKKTADPQRNAPPPDPLFVRPSGRP